MNKKEIQAKYKDFLMDYTDKLPVTSLRVACYFFQKMYLEGKTTIVIELNEFLKSGCTPYDQDPFITFENRRRLSESRILSAFEYLKKKQLFTITRIENRIQKLFVELIYPKNLNFYQPNYEEDTEIKKA